MDTPERDWRTAKAPKWALEAAETEIDAWKVTAALSWPTEPAPEPAPFRWGEYDRLTGEPVEGTYWTLFRGVQRVQIRRRQEGDGGMAWKEWVFNTGGAWNTCVTRGPLYLCERDARLALLWRECEDAARRLKNIRDRL